MHCVTRHSIKNNNGVNYSSSNFALENFSEDVSLKFCLHSQVSYCAGLKKRPNFQILPEEI